MAIAMDQKIQHATNYEEFGAFPGLANSLREVFPKLIEAFSERNYPTIGDKMEKIDKESWRRWERSSISPS